MPAATTLVSHGSAVTGDLCFTWGLSWYQDTESFLLSSLRIVCEIGDATLSKHEARVEVCIRDCTPNYRAISPKTFTFVVSPMLGTGLSPQKGSDAGWFWVVFWLRWKICHHFPEGQAGILWSGTES